MPYKETPTVTNYRYVITCNGMVIFESHDWVKACRRMFEEVNKGHEPRMSRRIA